MKREARVITNALLSFISRLVTAGVGILMVPFLLHSLGESIYGVIGIINSIMSFAILMELGIRPATARQFARFLFSNDLGRANELASTAMALYLMICITVILGIWLLAPVILETFQVAPSFRVDSTIALMLVAGSMGCWLVTTPYRAALISQLRHDVEYYSEIFGTLFRAGFIVALFLLWQAHLFIWALAVLLSRLVILVVTRWQSHVQCPSLCLSLRQTSRRSFRDLISIGTGTSLTELSNWLNQQSGPLIISYFLGTGKVAHYTPVLFLVMQLYALSGAFLGQLQPITTKAFVESDLETVRRVLFRSTRYSLLLTGGASLWVGSLAFVVVDLWLGEGFHDTALVLMCWCGATFLHSCVGGSYAIFLGAGRLSLIGAINGILAVLSLITSIVLVGFWGYGVLGAAIGVCATQAIRTALWLVMAVRISRADARSYLRKSYVGPLFCHLCLVGAIVVTQELITGPAWIQLLSVGGSSLIVFAGCGWLIGLSAEDREKALGYLRLGWRQTLSLVGKG